MSRQRKAQQPQPVETAGERWMQVLPRPDLARRDDDSVFMWMHRCLEAGGVEGLTWAWQPQNFPFGPDVRGRNFHTYGQLTREAEAKAKQQADEHARELAERNRNDAYEAKKKAGWAA